MTRPEIIVYRDSAGDLSVSIDGGNTSAFLTENGTLIPLAYNLPYATMSDANAYAPLLSDEKEVWRSGDKS